VQQVLPPPGRDRLRDDHGDIVVRALGHHPQPGGAQDKEIHAARANRVSKQQVVPGRDMMGMGASAGGVEALLTLCGALPSDLPGVHRCV